MPRTLKLKCVPPYDFDPSMRLFSSGDKQIRRYDEGKFWQVVRLDGKLVLVTLKATGTVDMPEVSAELESDKEVSAEDQRKCKQLLSVSLGADFDLQPFYREAKKDKIMLETVQRLRGLKVPSTVTVFEALVDSMVEQQISLNVAHVLEVNLIKKYGDPLDWKLESTTLIPRHKHWLEQRLETCENVVCQQGKQNTSETFQRPSLKASWI